MSIFNKKRFALPDHVTYTRRRVFHGKGGSIFLPIYILISLQKIESILDFA